MVETPWGPSDRLREGRLRPGPASSRAEVETSQRRRLFGAMVACVADRGYAATRLDDLVELSGVSTASFYRLFPTKDACFLAAAEELLGNALTATEIREDGPWEERVRGALGAFAGIVAAQPAAARMLLVDSFAAGPEAAAAVDRAVHQLEQRAVALTRESPQHAGVPDEVPIAIVGAVQELARNRLLRGRAQSLPHLMDLVADVALSYRPPSEPLAYTGRLPRPTAEELAVPGAADRATRALAVVAAERGYRQVTVEEVVRRASMSPTTFYAEFADKREAMLAAIDSAGAQMVAAALPTFRRSDNWPDALRTAFTDLLAYLASRPALARLTFVEVYAAGPEALQRRAEALAPLTALLSGRADRAPNLHGSVNEIVWAAIVATIGRQIRELGPHTLPALGPTLIFVALGPYLGYEGPSSVAFGGRGEQARKLAAIADFYREEHANRVERLLGRRASTPEEISAELEIEVEEVRRLMGMMLKARIVRSLEGRGESDPIEGRYQILLEDSVIVDSRDVSHAADLEEFASHVADNLWTEYRRSFEAQILTLRPEAVLVRVPMSVDEQGFREISHLFEKAMYDAIRVVEESRDRLAKTGEEPILATAGLLHFEVPPGKNVTKVLGQDESFPQPPDPDD
jgi:AcrR family transcriptional regulator